MSDLFNFEEPAVAIKTAPVVKSPPRFLAEGSQPMCRINKVVANALFDPNGSGLDGENWVLIPSSVSRFVVVSTDCTKRPGEFTHESGWKVIFQRYAGSTGVSPYQPSSSTQAALAAIKAAVSEDAIKAAVMAVVDTDLAVVDAAMLSIAARHFQKALQP